MGTFRERVILFHVLFLLVEFDIIGGYAVPVALFF